MFDLLIGRKRLAVCLLFLCTLVFSVICWSKIPLEVMPKGNEDPFLYLEVRAKTSAEVSETELSLAIPVEGAIRTVGNVKGVEATVQSGGVSFFVIFEPHTNMDVVVFYLNEALQELEDVGILDMRNVNISRFNPSATPVFSLTLEPPLNQSDIQTLVSKTLKSALMTVPGVAKVDIKGIFPKEVEYTLRSSQVSEYGLSGSELGGALNVNSERMSLGSVTRGSLGEKTGLRGTLIVENLDEVHGKVIKPGTSLTLGQVSRMKKIDKSQETISHREGRQVVSVDIYKSPDANVFELKEHLEDRLTSLDDVSLDLQHIKLEYLMDKSELLGHALSNVSESLYMAMIITFIVVLTFLRKVYPTVLISLVIPVTMVMVIALLQVNGASLNIVTLSGLILSIGLIVDNAIVVVERIQANREGLPRIQAAVKSAKEMAIPLLMSTLTTVVIFLPAAFIEATDTFTSLLKTFQFPIVAGLLVSYGVALIVIPVLGSMGRGPEVPRPPITQRKSDKNVMPGSVRFFKMVMKHRTVVLCLMLGFIYWSYDTTRGIAEVDIDDPEQPLHEFSIEFESSMAEFEKRGYFRKFEKKLLAAKDELGFDFAVSTLYPDADFGNFALYIQGQEDLSGKLKQLKSSIKKFLSNVETVPGVMVGEREYHFSGGRNPRKIYRFEGPYTGRLYHQLTLLKEELSLIPGVAKVLTEKEFRGRRTLLFIPHPVAFQTYGLELRSLSRQIQSLMQTYGVSGLKDRGERVETNIKILPASGGWDLDAFNAIKISTGKGRFVEISKLGELKEVQNFGTVTRQKNQARQRLQVLFSARGNDFQKAKLEVEGVIHEYPFDDGYGMQQDDLFAILMEMEAQTNFVVLLSLFLIFLLLSSLFESIVLPFAILFTVPCAIIFGILGLQLWGLPLDPMARLGLIILVGIVVNNAIILIDVILKLRGGGRPKYEAIALGCSQRLKAVFMTTATTVCGLLPVALGGAKIMGIPYASLGVVIISGLTLSTLITLILLPIVYLGLDGLQSYLGIQIRRFLKLSFS